MHIIVATSIYDQMIAIVYLFLGLDNFYFGIWVFPALDILIVI